MTDNDQLAQRYADLLEPDADFLPLLAELDAAAAPYRTLEPPRSLDQAIEQLAHQRQPRATNGPLPETIEPTPPSASQDKTRHLLPQRLHGGYTRQLLGMVAAIIVLVLFAGLIAALLRGPGGQSGVGGALTATPQLPTPNAEGEYLKMTLAQARHLVDFPIIEPEPLPDTLHALPDSSVIVATIGWPDVTQANDVAFYYPAEDAAEHGIALEQSTVQAVVPTDDDGVLHRLDPSGAPTTEPYKHLITNTVFISGVTVTKLDTLQDDGRMIYATWQKDGVYFVATSSLGATVTDRVFDQFIAALIAPGATIATPQTAALAPTAPPLSPAQLGSIPFAEAQKQASFYLAEPKWLPSYLVAQGVRGLKVDDQLTEPTLYYGPPDGSQSYSVQIVEYTEDHRAQPPGTLEVLTIAGHVIAHSTATVDDGTHSFFVWHDQGTIFQMDAKLADPLIEQDVEKMMVSMLGGDEATPQAGGSAVPTPNANGVYVDLTLEQAQQLAPFKIVMPIDLPPSFTFGGLSLVIPPGPSAGLAKGVPNMADMTFGSSDDPHWFVEINELWLGADQPDTPSAPATATSASGTPTVPADHALPPTFQIDDVTVTKDAGTNGDGQPVASYKWIQGNTMIFLAVAHFDVDHEPEIYDMIASMIVQGS